MTYSDKLYKREMVERLVNIGKDEADISDKTIPELEKMMVEYDNKMTFDSSIHN